MSNDKKIPVDISSVADAVEIISRIRDHARMSRYEEDEANDLARSAAAGMMRYAEQKTPDVDVIVVTGVPFARDGKPCGNAISQEIRASRSFTWSFQHIAEGLVAGMRLSLKQRLALAFRLIWLPVRASMITREKR